MQHIPPFGDRSRLRIGLLGGSFNPAHAGHIHISREALRRLRLDAVWWLVSPQNPLKPTAGMAPLAKRIAAARRLAASVSQVIVTDLEQRLGTTRTLDTLHRLQRRYPAARFVWLMGADNLAQMPRWWRWPEIYARVRVAVFDRSPYSYAALSGAAALRLAQARVSATRLLDTPPPAWSWCPIRRHPASATAIRTGKV
jgi:nicotinate-nucleotide adenylyltransferase